MNATRVGLWLLGIAFVLGGAYLLYFEANLSRWVSLGVLTAGLLLFIGLAVMAFSGHSSNDGKTVIEERPTTVVRTQREDGGAR
jgi:hypothetical protein